MAGAGEGGVTGGHPRQVLLRYLRGRVSHRRLALVAQARGSWQREKARLFFLPRPCERAGRAHSFHGIIWL